MNKHDRVVSVLKGEKVDYTPSGFWIHFPKDKIITLDGNVNEHEKFLKQTDIDLFKIMNENEFRRFEKIIRAEDWDDIEVYAEDSNLIINQRILIDKLVSINKGKNVILGTVYGLVASLYHLSGYKYNDFLKVFDSQFKENPYYIKKALDKVYESTLNMARATVNSGVSGIYYAALGGEKEKLKEDNFYKYIYPLELELMNEIKKISPINVLHICKENVDLKRYKDYPVDVVNWSIHESLYSLEEGFEIFKGKTILGGFDDNAGVLVNGSNKEIENETKNLLLKTKGQKFILGANCTLPTEIDYSRIKLVVKSSKKYGVII